MKKLILSLLVIAIAFTTNAQEKGKIRVGFDAGLALPNAGAGLNGDLDIRYNIMDNVNVGIKLGLCTSLKDMVLNESTSDFSATVCALTSTLVTGNYYFNKPGSGFAPFLGGGFGSYSIANIQIASTSDQSAAASINVIPERKFGGLLSGGFEAGHFRMALEYYLIPSSTLYDLNNANVGMTGNSFLNLSIGFYLGGGKWRK